jgi:hypothetical protein
MGAVAVSLLPLLAGRSGLRCSIFLGRNVELTLTGRPVKFNEVDVGRVTRLSIQIEGDRRGYVELTLELGEERLEEADLQFAPRATTDLTPFSPPQLRARIVPASDSNKAFVELVLVDPSLTPEPALPFDPPWATIPTTPSGR